MCMDNTQREFIAISNVNDLREFKALYKLAVEHEQKCFVFHEQQFFTPFAKYVIEYYDTVLGEV